ncbi:PREDICTED: NAC domain-containing protein 53-like [Camelina sativa]|uniref:NAC domain-containing protein 53-like n=1 Tax=Camelina sativa TaxID=90675 RepID=A0ABM0W2E9_CAMSA|nr:PREDICTED: NAC domain-containing protein 53-like [Camelina sativa]
MGGGSATSLAPGFRFHPTDEELVRYYLKRKICNKPFKFDAISVTDVYKSEPWDLPDKSKLKSRDLEWYFFSMLDKKYGNGSKTNRATEMGYWKTTGKDREIRNGSKVVGMKKTLVYHKGRAPRGERSNWVMHEYRLVDEELEKTNVHQQDAYVLCRIFQKSGSGPKNGEQYGAPFVEEEWEEEDDIITFVPDPDLGCEDHVYVHMDDIDQKPDNLVVYDAIPLPLNFNHGESSNNAETNYSDSINYIQPGNYVDSGGYFDKPEESSEKDQKPIIRDDDLHIDALFHDDEIGCGVQDGHTVNLQSSGNIFVTDSSCYNDFPVESNYLTGGEFQDPNSNVLQNDGLYLETNDLSSTQQDGFNVEDYLTFFDEDDENAQYLTFDPSQLMGDEDVFVDQEELFQEVDKEETTGDKQVVEAKEKDEASCSKQVDADATEFEPDYKYPFLKKASHMLGAIPAPPAFASEFPTKAAAIRLNAGQSSGSVHVTAGMITISDSNMGWSYDKNANRDLILFYRLVQENASGKLGNSFLTRAMLIFICFWVLLLSVSFKVSTLVTSR